MSELTANPRRWIGRTLVGISLVHTLLVVVSFSGIVQEMLADGFFNSVGEDIMRGAVSWFFFAGFLIFLFGLVVDLLEKRGFGSDLGAVGLVLLVMCVLGIILMPVSGFWLVLVPAVGMIWNGKKKTA